MRSEDIGKKISYWMRMNRNRVFAFYGIYQGEQGDHFRILSNGRVQEILKTMVVRVEILD